MAKPLSDAPATLTCERYREMATAANRKLPQPPEGTMF
jgi:hypothetical protein